MTVAVLGLGSIGLRHARNLLTLGEEVIGYDINEGCCDHLEELGGRAAKCRGDAIAAASAVVIATSSGQHLEDLGEAIDAGCHAFVEKPIAHRREGLDEIAERAQRAGLVIFVAHNLRYHPCVVRARAILNEGLIGTILWARLVASSYLPAWRPNQDYRHGYTADPHTGGILFDDIHEIDLANYLLGPATVAAAVARRTGQLEIASEDCADVILRHDGGWHSVIHMDYVTKQKQRATEICGSEGLLRVDISGRALVLFDSGGLVIEQARLDSTFDDDYISEMRDFLACARGGGTPSYPPTEAISVLEQVLTARAIAGLPQ